MSRALALTATLAVLAPVSAWGASQTELISALSNKETADAALDQLVALKDEAIPALGAIASDGHDLTQRGWAIVGLRRIGGAAADKILKRILEGGSQPVLVRTWAVSARVDLAPDLDALLTLAPLLQAYPAVRRPFTQRLSAVLATGPSLDVNRLLAVSAQDVDLQAAVAPLILGLPPTTLVDAMLHVASVQSRQLAAAYLASKGQAAGGAEGVAAAVVQALAFQPGAQQPPWQGGPLYIPGLRWTKGPATQLVGELIRWHVWCSLRGKAEWRGQIEQNLNSLGLGNVVGYQPSWGQTSSDVWLRTWAHVAGGRQAVITLLAEQGVAGDPRFKALLASLP